MVGLVLVFLIIDLRLVVPPLLVGLDLGWDAVVYSDGARRLLEGRDPWAGPLVYGISLGAPPPSLFPYLPFIWLPDIVIRWIWVLIGAMSAAYSMTKLKLPAWWLLFPPVVLGVMTGGTSLPVLALLVRGGAIADAVAIVARPYVALTVVLRADWRALMLAGLIMLASMPWWPAYLADVNVVRDAITSQSLGPAPIWVLPIIVVELFIIGRRRSAWLVVPSLWPYAQFYYAANAVPALRTLPATTLCLAIPVPGLVAVGLVIDLVSERLRGRVTAGSL